MARKSERLVVGSLRGLLGGAVGRGGHLLKKSLEDGLDGVLGAPVRKDGQLNL